jgi:hypothetical protein
VVWAGAAAAEHGSAANPTSGVHLSHASRMAVNQMGPPKHNFHRSARRHHQAERGQAPAARNGLCEITLSIQLASASNISPLTSASLRPERAST